jgi:hypothetical protein
MRSRFAIIAVLALVVVVLVVWKVTRETASPPSTQSTPPAKQSKIENQKSKIAAAAEAEEPSHLADTLNSPATDIRSDLRVVAEVVDAFRSNFPRDGNPVGSNAEITATLTGNNKLRLALIPPRHPAINKDGELCDRWGTPFFFHAESAHRMEIRSAGPDRKMWNEDDAVFTP